MAVLTRKMFLMGCLALIDNSQKFQELKGLLKDLSSRNQSFETITLFISDKMTSELDNLFPLIPTKELKDLLKPKLIVTRNATFLRSIYKAQIGNPLSIAIIDDEDVDSKMFKLVAKGLKGIRHNPILFYFHISPVPEIVQIKMTKFCQWTQYQQFPNSLVMFRSSEERYGCEWYPSIRFVNQTLLESSSLLRKSATGVSLNLRGKLIEIPIVEEKPRVFKTFYNESTEELLLSGLCWKIFKLFIEHSNGRLKPYLLNKIGNFDFKTINDVMDLIDNRTIYITPNGAADLDIKKFSITYPIRIVDYCIMVPVISRVPSYLYIVSPFQDNVQLALLAVLITSSFVIYFISGFKSFSLSFINSVSGLLNSSFAGQISEVFIISSRFFQLLIRAYGFVFTNYYNCILSSFLASTLYGDQIDTIEDMIKASVTTIIQTEDYETLKGYNVSEEFMKTTKLRGSEFIYENRLSLNNSFAYLLTSDKWEYHEDQQRFMEEPLLRYSKICFAQFFLSFPLSYDSMFLNPFNFFIMQCQSSGFISYWKMESLRDLQNATKPIFSNVGALPMDVTYFKIAWECIGLGLGISLFTFCFELLNYKYFY